ncbi:SDR family oxidoreductase [Marinifilum sp. D714]|uniref:SDR family oxidoreductase n=1 Tax=Marinifilum sp. D714 TaxID=2937523 RepID=UPI0027C11D2B|nr:SDR family oxidoreductase [Marinifilum sp. D714]MDQ2177841.1 SDR family oxidoreductase [Marinifilum sp. D714]
MKKTALVSGSNRGIGYACVQELLQKGHRVILTARTLEDGKKAIEKLKSFGEVHFHQLDVSDERSVQQIVKYVEDSFGHLDILINNAGINYDTWHSAFNADLEEIHQTLETNLFGAWLLAQAFIPNMKKQKYGRIVNVSSGLGALSNMSAGTPGYSISKAAMNVLTIKLGQELKRNNILVNSVCPGWVRTDMGGSTAPRDPQKGAETIVWAAELEDKGPTGKFFRDMEEIEW